MSPSTRNFFIWIVEGKLSIPDQAPIKAYKSINLILKGLLGSRLLVKRSGVKKGGDAALAFSANSSDSLPSFRLRGYILVAIKGHISLYKEKGIVWAFASRTIASQPAFPVLRSLIGFRRGWECRFGCLLPYDKEESFPRASAS